MPSKCNLGFLFLLFGTVNLNSQQIVTALDKLNTQRATEKIYIHFDKEYYVAGEIVWFKAYLYSNGRPSTLSNNFYLQLINMDGNVISNKKYPVKGATVKGDIELPNTLSQGYYHIRALTPGMLNTNQDFFYSKNLYVFNPSSNAAGKLSSPALPSLSLQFFPESGPLVTDILSVIAFKATDSTGRPSNISGTIKSDDGTEITSFKTFYNGMGTVQFRPKAGKKYIAAVKVNGQSGFYPLPEVEASGINLRVENEKGGKMFLLSRSKKGKDDYNNLRILAEVNNLPVYDMEINFDTYYSVRGHLLTDSLPSGILHFTVFDKDGKTLAERLTFLNNGGYESKAVIEIEKKGMEAREENEFTINFSEKVQRSFSVSVTDAETSSSLSRENIISKLLLTDDLNGHIDNPAWYFQDKKDTVRETALENLMLTHGWSRYSWKKDNTREASDKKYKDSYLVSVSGKLNDSKTNGPAPGGNLSIFLESEDSVNHNFDIPVRGDGTFTIDSLLFYGKAKFYYAYKTAQGKEKPVNIFLDPQPVDIAVEAMPYKISEEEIAFSKATGETEGAAIYKRYRTGGSTVTETKELGAVVVEAKNTKRPLDIVNDEYTSGMFTALGKENIDNINQPNNDKSVSVYDYLRNNIRQVQVQDNNFVNRKNFSISRSMTFVENRAKEKKIVELEGAAPGVADPGTLDRARAENAPGKQFVVALFMNESPTNADFLKTIRMDQVALIKFYDPGFAGAASSGPGGAIAIYAKKDVQIHTETDKQDHVVYKGYSLTKEFYSPDYSLPVKQNLEEDIRTTLYWNPELYTDNNSTNTRLKFYNNDFSKKLKIVVEGFDANGKLIHIEKIIEK
jgi:hypothetical protein